MDNLKRRENESKLGYFKRITDNRKEYELSYEKWGELIIGENRYSDDNCRKAFYLVKPILDILDDEYISKMPRNKLKEVEEELGELFVVKQEVKNKTNKLNKIKRDFSKSIEIANELKEYIKEEFEFSDIFTYERIEIDSDNKLIIHCGDWHIGYVIKNYKGNFFNYEIAKKRLAKLIGEARKVCELYDIKDVILVNAGDVTEGSYMRQNQSYECEFNMNEQIVKATRLLYDVAVSVSEFANVDIVTVGGNHSRASSKDANIEGDNANVVIKEVLGTIVEVSGNERIRMLDVDYIDDSCVIDIFGHKIKVLHGDNRPSLAKKLYDGEVSMDNVNYLAVLRGHYHNFNVSSQNSGGYVVTCGCLFGYNPYSVKRMSCNTNASQSLIVINSDGIELIKDVNLQIN